MITSLFLATALLFTNPTSDEPTASTPTQTTIAYEDAEFNYNIDFSQWVNDRLVYPEQAKENYINGRVYVTFTVDQQGKVKNVKVDKGICDVLNKEAVRVISLSPKWTPAKINGQPIETHYCIAINFELS